MSTAENKGIDRFCILATRDKHASLERNLRTAPVATYLRDTESGEQVRKYIDLVQGIEALCFNMPAPNWSLAHFGLNGGSFTVTAEINNEPVAAQYVSIDGFDGRFGLRFWTTVVHPELRRVGIASCLTAISTEATKSWAEFGSTICDTNSSLMGRNVKLKPLIVTANMHHTLGRKKVLLEWQRPEDPFKVITEAYEPDASQKDLTVIESLAEYSVSGLPPQFLARADSGIWEEIALHPERYRRYFDLIGWNPDQQLAALQTPKNT